MDEDITLQEILRRLAEENPNIYPVTPSWMSPFPRGLWVKEYGPPPESFNPNQSGNELIYYNPDNVGMPPSGPQVAVANYKAQKPVKEEEPKAVAEDEEDSTDDLLNQLLMAALMAGGKRGKQAGLGGAAGGGISFGDPWKMRRDWERDYRYLQS